MERILERYERYSYAERQLVPTDLESQVFHSVFLVKLNFVCPSDFNLKYLVLIPYFFFFDREAGLWSMQSSRLG